MNDQGHIQIRVLSVDDHPLMREGIARIINDQPDIAVIAQAASGAEAIRQFRQHRPDVTLLDLRLPDMSGIDVLIAIRAEFYDAKVLVLTTATGDVEIQRALKAGARGYILKSMSPPEMTEAVRQVYHGKRHVPPEVAAQIAEHMGEPELTSREQEVLRHLAGGNRNRDIGDLLFVSEETIKAHVKNIMEKLGASDRTEAIAIAVRRGIMQL
jgi:DNA-binding NarL/FixJ family response regulator